jgi:pyrroline-5-carboxylate reductase
MVYTFGIIGLGNMGSAIISQLLKKHPPEFELYYVFDIQKEKAQTFTQFNQVSIAQNEIEVAKNSDYILFAVKPQVISSVIDKLKPLNLHKKIFISILAGTPLSFFQNNFDDTNYFIRVMPNIAILVGEGATGICIDPRLDGKKAQIVQDIFNCVGKVITCEERYLDIVTGVSGSGPAYIFIIIEAMADGAVKMGLPRDKAYILAAQTVIGAGTMVLELKKHPGELKDLVTSPAGTSIEAISVLERGNVRSIFIDAIEAATKRAQALRPKE